MEELGKGNNSILPSFISTEVTTTSSKAVVAEHSIAIETPKIETMAESSTEMTAENRHQMVMHNGALIDIEKLLQQLNRSEKAREETEWRLSELNKAHTELQSSSSKAKDKIKDLQSELKSCNRKMNDAESSLSSANVSFIERQLSASQDSFYSLYFLGNFRKNAPNTIHCYAVFRIRSVQ